MDRKGRDWTGKEGTGVEWTGVDWNGFYSNRKSGNVMTWPTPESLPDLNDKMIRVFPRKTKWTPIDDLAFVGEPPLPFFRPDNRKLPVMVSCAFTWDLPEAKRLRLSWGRFYDDVQLGGPACNNPGDRFTSGQFIKEGVTITSRGCPKRCPWCFVWRREGEIRTLPIVPGHIVEDNNILACPRWHIEAVFDMLTRERKVVFAGGLDTSLLRDWHRKLFETIRYDELWFACDTRMSESDLIQAAAICDGISIEKLRCYVMIGFGGESLFDACARLEWVYSMGFLPFAQLYRGEQSVVYSPEWKKLARKWSQPAAYRARKAST